ncbi:MAG: phosphatase PAP2 family protein [Dehalococcoidia bacterium]
MNRTKWGVSGKSCLLVAGTLGTVALFVLAWAYPNFAGDEEALVRFQALRTDWLDSTALGLAKLGKVWVFVPAAAVLVGCLLTARSYADSAMVVAGLAVFGIGNGLKLLVDRPRPEYHLFESVQSSLSFPSGHALLAVIMGGVLVYLAGRWVKLLALRRAIQIGLILMVLAMGASRVYLGVHWPSDVIGSYAFGLMALAGLIGFRNAVASAR